MAKLSSGRYGVKVNSSLIYTYKINGLKAISRNFIAGGAT